MADLIDVIMTQEVVLLEKRYSIAEAKNQLPALVHETEKNQPIFILRRGQPVAVLPSTREYERLQAHGKKWFWSALADFRNNAIQQSGEAITEEDLQELRDVSPGREPQV